MSRKPGFYPDVPAEEYHEGLQQDPRPLSSTLAKDLLRKLPAEAKWTLEHGEHKVAYDEGRAIHELILEGDLKTIVELPFDSWRTKASQEAKGSAYLDGLTPMLPRDLDPIRHLAATVRANPDVNALVTSGGQAELSALATIDGVPVQARYDYLRLPDDTHRGFILDLKTVARSASPRDFMRNAASYGYHIQAAFYQMVLEALGHPDVPFFWLVVSKQEPHAHSIIQASSEDLQVGRDLAYRALEIWESILKDGWPTNTPITQSALPAWILYEAMEQAL